MFVLEDGLRVIQKKKMVLVGVYAIIWTIWTSESDIVFERKQINDPIVLIKLFCHWITNRAILHTNEEHRKVLMLRTRLIEQVASEVYEASKWRWPGVL